MIKVSKVLNLDNQNAENRSIIYKYDMNLHTSLHLIKTKRIHRRGTTAKNRMLIQIVAQATTV